MYHYTKSFVKLNPIRLNVALVFPQQNDSEFTLDVELRGVIINNIYRNMKFVNCLLLL